MGLYDAFKDVLNIAQKADNIELYRRLLDLSKDALELQNENWKLEQQIQELKKTIEEEKNIIRHKDGTYVTIKGDEQEIPYCAICWGNHKKLIQLLNGKCHNCQSKWIAAVKSGKLV